jgi:thiol:disulfide interchange protein DsbC
MKRMLLAAAALALAFAAGVRAGGDATDPVKLKIAKALGIQVSAIHDSAAAGLYEIVKEHDFGYVTTDGKFLLQGDLVNIDTGEQITENHRRAERLAALHELGPDNMVAFAPAPPMASKYVVTVFTDVDCPYCRKLHSQIAEYNARGIEIRYVFFPRTGLNTPSYYTAESVWCSADRQAALTKAKLGQPLARRECDNPVAREYQLGVDLGVHGTPAMILPDGEEVPGYIPPEKLADALDAAAAKTALVAAPPADDNKAGGT